MSDLKNCPFCGGDKVSVQHGTTSTRGQYLMVWCVSCQAAGGEHLVEAEAIAAWNHRAYLDAVGGETVAWRWKPKTSSIWIYDPDARWLDAHRNDTDIDLEPLYAAPQAPAVQVKGTPEYERLCTAASQLSLAETISVNKSDLRVVLGFINETGLARIRSALEAETGGGEHPDDLAVDRFATAMKAKLKWEREERNRSGWQDMSAADLSRLLYEHLPKGDPIDVANLAMMLHQNGQQIEAPATTTDERAVEALTAGWNACRKSVYAVCEDVQNEADRLQKSSKPGTAAEEQHAKGYYAGTRYAAKSIARGFNSMEAQDDVNFRAALAQGESRNG